MAVPNRHQQRPSKAVALLVLKHDCYGQNEDGTVNQAAMQGNNERQWQCGVAVVVYPRMLAIAGLQCSVGVVKR